MKPSTEDQAKGKLHEVKGDLKEKVGNLTGNDDMAAEGTGEKIGGKIQKGIGKIEKAIGE